jgi:hypothetical protein
VQARQGVLAPCPSHLDVLRSTRRGGVIARQRERHEVAPGRGQTCRPLPLTAEAQPRPYRRQQEAAPPEGFPRHLPPRRGDGQGARLGGFNFKSPFPSRFPRPRPRPRPVRAGRPKGPPRRPEAPCQAEPPARPPRRVVPAPEAPRWPSSKPSSSSRGPMPFDRGAIVRMDRSRGDHNRSRERTGGGVHLVARAGDKVGLTIAKDLEASARKRSTSQNPGSSRSGSSRSPASRASRRDPTT